MDLDRQTLLGRSKDLDHASIGDWFRRGLVTHVRLRE